MTIQKSNRNALAIANNPYQGREKKVLCICSAGLLRSPTIANVLHREFGYNTRSAGSEQYALIPVNEALLAWADEIVAPLDENVDEILGYFKTNSTVKPIYVLDIEDNYWYMEEDLQNIIKKNYITITGITP